MPAMKSFDAIIIGAGAAGLMCALTAGQRGRRVLLLEHGPKIGAKILISGGGRCNFTNLEASAERFLSANRHFCKSALKRYSQHDFIALVERHRIPYHEKTLGQLFCDGSAREIVAMLRAECDAGGVDIRTHHRVTGVSRSDRYTVVTDKGKFDAPCLVVATGGLSVPQMGATGFAYDLVRRFGLAVRETRPALVPLTLGGADLEMASELSGVSLPVVARCNGAAFAESMLFTHRGLSGPAILQISSYWREGAELAIDLMPGEDAAAFLLSRKAARPKAEVRTVLGEALPHRLAHRIAEREGLSGMIGAVTDKRLRGLAEQLKRWRITPSGSEGYRKAEVTLGGVDTDHLSSRSMEARDVPGLFVIGEAVDVTGWLGGYNFQWAWSSGRAAGEAI